MARRKTSKRKSMNTGQTVGKHDVDPPHAGGVRTRSLKQWVVVAVILLATLAGAFGFIWGTTRLRLDRAIAAMELWRFEQAERLLQSDSSWGLYAAQTRYLLGRVARSENGYARSQQHLSAAMAGRFDSAAVTRELALLETQNGKITPNSARQMEVFLTQAPADQPAILEAYAIGNMSIGNDKSAFILLDRWIDAYPGDGRPFYWKALARQNEGDLDDALNLYKESVRRNPRLIDSHMAIAAIHANAERSRDALKVYQRASELEPDHIESRLGQADMLWRLRRRDDAVSKLEPLLSGHINLYPARRMATQLLVSKDSDPATSIALIKPLLDRFPESARLNYLSATVSFQLNDVKAFKKSIGQFFHANEQMNRLHYLEPGAKQRLNLAELLQIATQYRRWEWEKELSWLELAEQEAPRSAEVHFRLARHHEERGSIGLARREANIAETLLYFQSVRSKVTSEQYCQACDFRSGLSSNHAQRGQ